MLYQYHGIMSTVQVQLAGTPSRQQKTVSGFGWGAGLGWAWAWAGVRGWALWVSARRLGWALLAFAGGLGWGLWDP